MKSNYFLLLFTFFIAIILTIVPMPQAIIWFRPQWILMALLFWIIAMPSYYGVILAWMMGVFTDMITGTPIGQQAFIFVFIAYAVLKLHPIIFHSPRWQQALIIGIFAGINVLMRSLILGFTGHSTHIGLNALSILTTMVLWPLVHDLLDSLRANTSVHYP